MSLEPTADPPETIFDIRAVPNDYTIFWAKCPECRDAYHSFSDTQAQRLAFRCYFSHDWTDGAPPDGDDPGDKVLAHVDELIRNHELPDIVKEVAQR